MAKQNKNYVGLDIGGTIGKGAIVDPETGEVATPPKIKYTKSSLNILFAKE